MTPPASKTAGQFILPGASFANGAGVTCGAQDAPRRDFVDWDTTLFAPRERDLRMVLDEDLTGWDDYVAVFGDASPNERALELYRRWWDLADSAVYIALFRNPHDRDGNTVASWENLTHCLASLSGA